MGQSPGSDTTEGAHRDTTAGLRPRSSAEPSIRHRSGSHGTGSLSGDCGSHRPLGVADGSV